MLRGRPCQVLYGPPGESGHKDVVGAVVMTQAYELSLSFLGTPMTVLSGGFGLFLSYLRMGRDLFCSQSPPPLIISPATNLFAGAQPLCIRCACMALVLPGPTGTVWLLGLDCLQFGLHTLRMTQPEWDEGVIVGIRGHVLRYQAGCGNSELPWMTHHCGLGLSHALIDYQCIYWQELACSYVTCLC